MTASVLTSMIWMRKHFQTENGKNKGAEDCPCFLSSLAWGYEVVSNVFTYNSSISSHCFRNTA